MNARLTAKELETLRFITEGFTNLQIANKIGKSESGVGRRVSWLLFKTGARNRTHLAALAYKNGYLEEASGNEDGGGLPPQAEPGTPGGRA